MKWNIIAHSRPGQEFLEFTVDGKVYKFKLTPKYPVWRIEDKKQVLVACAHQSSRGLAFFMDDKAYFYSSKRFLLMQCEKDKNYKVDGL